MIRSPRRQKNGYFPVDPTAPRPLTVRLVHRVRFSDVDPMAILWHGRYARLFEQANEELGRICGMGYGDFRREKLGAPIVQFHVDYFAPVTLDEQVTIVGRMIWDDAARSNIEYEILKENGTVAATGYTVQMFVDEIGQPQVASPALLETCRRRWRAGEFGGAQ
ncbi:MAG TPA: acyl-CoA thioesterase [Tepidisphaeraceae bacterium]|nr:acyl-CoA thioesterase [Tepidisphaeraceae bacterium]